MQYREIGQSGINASAVSLGAWSMGGGAYWGNVTDDDEAVRTIHLARELGINYIDTAPAYGFGYSERVVGKAVAGSRGNYHIASKCGLCWDRDSGYVHLERDGRTVRRDLSADAINSGLEATLKNLGTDYLDVYLTHWPSMPPNETPVEETAYTLNQLKKQGKIRAVGACNVDVELIKRYLSEGHLDVVQNRFSILSRESEQNGVVGFCAENGITFQPYSPLEQGLMAGKIGMDYRPAPEEGRARLVWMAQERRADILKMLDGWRDICREHDATLSAIVIAWCVGYDQCVNLLSGARKTEHLLQNVKGGDIILSAVQRQRMTDDANKLVEKYK